jgi:hypothetical protein
MPVFEFGQVSAKPNKPNPESAVPLSLSLVESTYRPFKNIGIKLAKASRSSTPIPDLGTFSKL